MSALWHNLLITIGQEMTWPCCVHGKCRKTSLILRF